MLSKLFASREVLEYDLEYCKLYKTKYNGMKSTKIYFVYDPVSKYEMIKGISHPNIVSIYRITKHSIFTKPLEPFSVVFDKKKRKYLKYVLWRLKSTIDFIHEKLNIKDLHLTMNSLFVDSFGNVVIGNFNKFTKIGEKSCLNDKMNKFDLKENLDSKSIRDNQEMYEQSIERKEDYNSDNKFTRINKELYGKITDGKKDHSGKILNEKLNFKNDHCNQIENDYFYLNELSKQFLDVEFNEISEDDDLFGFLEDPEQMYENLSVDEKKELLRRILKNKDEYITQIKENICRMMINNVMIKKNNNNEFNLEVIKFLFEFERDLMDKYSKELFMIIDTPIRFYLLKHMKKTKSLNECIEEICLGLKVKLYELKAETINFIFNNYLIFTKKSSQKYLEIMKNEINDSESIELICKRLIECKRSDLNKYIFDLLLKFVMVSNKKEAVYLCIEEYFPLFNKQKVSSELLPYLCSKLADQDGQNRCFILVEKIISYLKKYKKEILKRGWSIDNLKGMLITKKDISNNERIEDQYQNVWKNEIDSEWDEHENI